LGVQAGGLLPDGSLPQMQQRNSVSQLQSTRVDSPEVPLPFGKSQGNLQKRPGLKADANIANGGVGVTYSNVVLGGGFNPNQSQPKMQSLYQGSFDL